MDRLLKLQGFDPLIVETGGDVRLLLGSCKFREAPAADPETVCSVHRGIVEGAARRSCTLELFPRDPGAGWCVTDSGYQTRVV